MAARLFEKKEHAAIYKKYRFSAQENLQKVIFAYLDKKLNSFRLAVDVGCGSGQSTQLLAGRFEKVVGTDVSEAQIEEAKQAGHPPHVSFLACPAEEVPLDDHSADLVVAFTAAHWFDIPRFMTEVDRLLAPSGCVILCSNTLDLQLRYGDCSEELTEILREVIKQISPYKHEKINRVLDDYKEIFDAVPFQDKERITDIFDKMPMSVANLVGYIQSFSPYQTFLKKQPEAAKSLVAKIEQRLLETMGVSSEETQLELWTRQVCVLAHKKA
uniref:Methyltransferase type 11 domain-containing protein n=1 Tax=Salvator merianae TaxID=96440 RepID=A0A8D0DLW3_SALMN